MGRSKNGKRKLSQQQQQGGGRQSKRSRHNHSFWILDCEDTSKKPQTSQNEDSEQDGVPDIEILVTRIELVDDYLQIPPIDHKKVVGADGIDLPADTKATITAATTTETLPIEEESKIIHPDVNFEEYDAPILDFVSYMKKSTDAVDIDDDERKGDVVEETEKSRLKNPIEIAIRKAKSAKRPIQKHPDYVEHFKNLPNGDCGDGIINPYPKEEVPDKYWSQRRRLFSLFDRGIQLDKESWYSVTPEVIANHIAAHLVGHLEDAIILDPFCGCGGNTIAFALRKEVKQVLCVDMDLQKLKRAYWNASIYGVQDKLFLVHGDAGTILSQYSNGTLIPSQNGIEPKSHESLPTAIDAIFLSPPWGGIHYGTVGKHGYDIKMIKITTSEEEDGQQYDGEWILEQAIKALGDKGIAYFLPKNTNGVAFAESAYRSGYRNPVVLEQNFVNGKLKTVTAYLGLGS